MLAAVVVLEATQLFQTVVMGAAGPETLLVLLVLLERLIQAAAVLEVLEALGQERGALEVLELLLFDIPTLTLWQLLQPDLQL